MASVPHPHTRFMYEEEEYNHWGHSDNVLRRERTMAAFLALFIAGLIGASIVKQYPSALKAKRSGSQRNMV